MPLTYSSAFLMNNGTVKTIGENTQGQCGTGNTASPQLSPYLISGLTNVIQIAGGYYHTVFLLSDGTVKTCGRNGLGQCGTGTTATPQLALYTIPGLTGVKQIAAGEHHTVFLMNDGTVKTCGYNAFGQCGTGDTTSPQLSLYTISGVTDVVQIAATGSHTILVKLDGTVIGFGRNDFGQCGYGNTTHPKLSLTQTPTLSNVKQAACSDYHTAFLLNDGTIKTCGYNAQGQCGTGTTTSPQVSLYTIPGLAGVIQISAGDYYTAFLINSGYVKLCGRNEYGQCGTGNTISPQLALYTIAGLSNVKQISCGYSHTVFLLNDGTVKTVGLNLTGQCGTGTTSTTQLSLYTISGLTGVKLLWDYNIPALVPKCLIKFNGNYYSIKSAYYDIASKTYNPLTLAGGSVPNSTDILNYGFETISDLLTYQTINSETFLPADKMFSSYSIQRYKPK